MAVLFWFVIELLLLVVLHSLKPLEGLIILKKYGYQYPQV